MGRTLSTIAVIRTLRNSLPLAVVYKFAVIDLDLRSFPGSERDFMDRNDLAWLAFRAALLSPLLTGEVSSAERGAYFKKLASELHTFPNGQRATVSVRTLRRWYQRLREQGLDGLKPQRRSDRGKPRKCNQAKVARAIELKREQASRSRSGSGLTRAHLRRLRNEIEFQNLLAFLNWVHKRREGRLVFQCPRCHETLTGIHGKTNLARCFLCEVNWNPIDFTIETLQVDFLSAVALLDSLLPRRYGKPDPHDLPVIGRLQQQPRGGENPPLLYQPNVATHLSKTAAIQSGT